MKPRIVIGDLRAIKSILRSASCLVFILPSRKSFYLQISSIDIKMISLKLATLIFTCVEALI